MAQTVKNLPLVWETLVQSLSWGDPLVKEKATYFSIFCLENSMGREASVELQIHGVAESDMAERLSLFLIPLICFTSLKIYFKL